MHIKVLLHRETGRENYAQNSLVMVVAGAHAIGYVQKGFRQDFAIDEHFDFAVALRDEEATGAVTSVCDPDGLVESLGDAGQFQVWPINRRAEAAEAGAE